MWWNCSVISQLQDLNKNVTQQTSKCVAASERFSFFISYSHDDKTFARLLYDKLQKRGFRCWFDEHELLPGERLHQSIAQGVLRSEKMLLCASRASLTSWWVDNEIGQAFQMEAQWM